MKLRNELKAGIFILGCLLLLAALVFILGQDRQIFAHQEEYYTSFLDVKGLAVGAPIRLGGISIGRVAHIGFSSDLTDNRVHVTLLINDAYADRVRGDSVVSIETQGLLGDRFLSISSGQDQQLPAKSDLRSNEVADISQVLAKAQTAIDNTVGISEKVNSALEGLKPETIAKLGDAAQSFSSVMEDIKNKNGFLHRLIYSEKDGTSLMKSISSATDDISSMIKETREGTGFLHTLIFDPAGPELFARLSLSLKSFGEAADGFASLVKQSTNGTGLIHDLLYTPVEPGSVGKRVTEAVNNISATANNLKIASDALAQGTGTLGALLIDPKLYDNLIEVTDGAKRSFLLRQAIRSSLQH